MQYRQFGKTKEQVSVLGFGCMRLPVIDSDPTCIDEGRAIPMIRQAIDAGVNYVDTAYPYHGSGFQGGGASEPFVAKALAEGYRDKVKLATKLPSWLIKTREDMDRFLNLQLERLQTEYIDFYLVHSLNAAYWPALKAAGVTDFLEQALADGRIRHAGFSFHDKIGLFKEIVDSYDWSFCQIQYNYLDEVFQAGREGLEYAAAKGLGIAVMEPLRGGNLVRLPEAARAVLDGTARNWTAAEWALRWVWDHPEVSVVLSGMTAQEQVQENLRIAAEARPHSLTDADKAAVGAVKALFQERVRIPCTACGYCLPCPSAINIPACFAAYNDHWVFDGTPDAKHIYGIWAKLAAPASRCVECGQCEGHCPQGIAIRSQLKDIVSLFE